MENMKYYSLDQIEDKYIGNKGTKKRDEYDASIQSFLVGDAMKKARIEKKITQDQLGVLLGVQRAQVSRIEHGKNLTLATIARYMNALEKTVTIKIGELEVAL